MRSACISALAYILCASGCGPAGNPPAPNPPSPNQPAPGAAQPGGATNDAAKTEVGEGASKMEWQLADDSVFFAAIEPWPPKAGAAMLKTEATLDDFEQKFAGNVSYRFAATIENSVEWQPLPRVREDDDDSVYFEAPISLQPGSTYLQFRLLDAGDSEPTELLDWKLDVK
jgi:hypothetical protein